MPNFSLYRYKKIKKNDQFDLINLTAFQYNLVLSYEGS